MSSVEKFLSDYTSPTHSIVSCDLIFTITESHTIVENTIVIKCISEAKKDLSLDGVNLELLEIELDGVPLSIESYVIE
jgi:aminopeptidase N